ncbi:hypothetical protein HOG21_01280 [bacterium]|jgi:hypothetical protein|nr:hypothetical protein [bacterium]
MNNEMINAIIANFGIGHIYSHIIPHTANIAAKASNLDIVDKITHVHTSCTHTSTASNLVFHSTALVFKCLDIFSTTTVELSTSIQRTSIKAKRVILLIFSPNINANKKTSHKVKGIETAVLNASFLHKYNINTINTIITD